MNELNFHIDELNLYREICIDVRNWDKQRVSLATHISHIRGDLANIQSLAISNKFDFPFTMVEKELNNIVARADISNPRSLLPELERYFSQLRTINDQAKSLKETKEKLSKMPQRHGIQEVIVSIDSFLAEIPTIKLSIIPSIQNTVLPSLFGKLDRLKSSFLKERDRVQLLFKKAGFLRENIMAHSSYVDHFGLLDICKRGEITIQRIMHQPNYSDIDSEFALLEKISKEIDACEIMFKNDLKRFVDLCSSLDRTKVWKEDNAIIQDELGKAKVDYFHYEKTSDDISSIIDKAIYKKTSMMSDIATKYHKHILKRHKNEIYNLRSSIVPINNYYDLLHALDRDVKKFRIWIITIVAAIVILIIVILLNILCFMPAGLIADIIVAGVMYFVFKD